MYTQDETHNIESEDSEDDDSMEYYMPAYAGEYDIKKKIIEANEALFAESNVEQLFESTASKCESKKIVKFGRTTICFHSDDDDESDSNGSNDTPVRMPSLDYFNQSPFLETEFNDIYKENDKIDELNNIAYLNETEVTNEICSETTKIKFIESDYTELTFQNDIIDKSVIIEEINIPKNVDIFIPGEHMETENASLNYENNICDHLTVKEEIYEIKDNTPIDNSKVVLESTCTKEVNLILNCSSQPIPKNVNHITTIHNHKRNKKHRIKDTIQSEKQQSRDTEANEKAFQQWIQSKRPSKHFVRPKIPKNTKKILSPTQIPTHIQNSIIDNPTIKDTGKGVLKIDYVIHCLSDN